MAERMPNCRGVYQLWPPKLKPASAMASGSTCCVGMMTALCKGRCCGSVVTVSEFRANSSSVGHRLTFSILAAADRTALLAPPAAPAASTRRPCSISFVGS